MADTPIKDLLFGRLAREGRFITEEQIADCVELQRKYREKGGAVPRIGELLALKGYMSPEQVRAVLEGQHTSRGGLFGEIAVRWRFVERRALDEALRLQHEMDAAGRPRERLGEILVKRGQLQAHQVPAILEAQGKKIVQCPGCSARFNVAQYRPGSAVTCPRCGAESVLGGARRREETEASAVDASQTIYATQQGTPEEEQTDTQARRALEIGGYEILARLGSDATGAFCKARHQGTGNVVVLKIMRPGPQIGQDFLERFVEQTRRAVLLDHPNLKRVYEVGCDRGRYFLAEEFVEGRTLKRQLETVGRLTPAAALEVAGQLAGALAYGHGRGIVHGDLRPECVHIDATGKALLSGLGVTKDAALNLRYFGRSAESVPYYLAPEQAVDAARTDARSDVYSLGAMLYHMIAGRPPYAGQGSLEVLMRLTQEPLIPPRQIDPRLPAELSALVERMLTAEPDERPQTIAEVQAGLKDIAAALRPTPAAAAAAAAAAAPAHGAPAKQAAAGAAVPRRRISDRQQKSAPAPEERRYGRERFAPARKSSGATAVIVGLVLAAGGAVAVGWLVVNRDQGGRPGPAGPAVPPVRPVSPTPPVARPDPATGDFNAAVKFADGNVGDDAEAARRFRAFFEKHPDSDFARPARERHRTHVAAAARRALTAAETAWRTRHQPAMRFAETVREVEEWRRAHPDADEVLKAEAARLAQAAADARKAQIEKSLLAVDRLVESRDFAGARRELGIARSLVSDEALAIVAEKTARIDAAEKIHIEEQRLARIEEEKRKREEEERRGREAASEEVAQAFERLRLGVAKAYTARQFEKALTDLAAGRGRFADTPHAATCGQLDSAIQACAAYSRVLEAGLRSGRGEPRLTFGQKARAVSGITRDGMVVLDLGDAGKINLPWKNFAADDLAALGLLYADAKDGQSLLGYAMFCQLCGAKATAADYAAKAGALGADASAVQAVLKRGLLDPWALAPETPETPEKPPVAEPAPPPAAEPAPPPAVDKGPGTLAPAVNRDTRITCHSSETGYNSGKAQRLRVRDVAGSSAEFVLLDFDRARLRTFIAERPARQLSGQLVLYVWELHDGPAAVEVAALVSASDWAEGDKTLAAAEEGEATSLEARKGVEPWKTAAGLKVADFRELFYDRAKKQVNMTVNGRSAEVKPGDKAAVIELEDEFIRHLAADENCRGLVLFTRHAQAKIDFFSRERQDSGPRLVIVAGEPRGAGPAVPAPPAGPEPPVQTPAPPKETVGEGTGAPARLHWEELTEAKVRLVWDDNSADETGFEVQRSDQVVDKLTVALKTYNGRGKPPAVVPGGFIEGAVSALGVRDYWKRLPAVLRGRAAMLCAPGDAGMAQYDTAYEVRLGGPCTIYLPMRTEDGDRRPNTLNASWAAAGMTCSTGAHDRWTVWKREVREAGDVILPCHRDRQTGYGLCYVFSGETEIRWRFVGDVKAGVTSYEDTAVEPDRLYWYRVRAMGAAGARSPYCDPFRVIVPPAPPKQ